MIAGLPEDQRDWLKANGGLDERPLSEIVANMQANYKFNGADKATLIRKPKGDRATEPEAWAAYDRGIGVPEKADGYAAYTPPQGFPPLDKELADKLYTRMHAAGSPQESVTAALDVMHELAVDVIKAENNNYAKEVATGLSELKAEWGADYEARLKRAQQMTLRLPEGVREGAVQLFDDSGLGDDPRLIRMFDYLDSQFGEDGPPQGGRGGAFGKPTKDQAKAELSQIESVIYTMDRTAPDFDAKQKRREELEKIINEG